MKYYYAGSTGDTKVKRAAYRLLYVVGFLLCIAATIYVCHRMYERIPQDVSDAVVSVTENSPPDYPGDSPCAVISEDSICTGEEGADASVVDAANLKLLILPRWLRQTFLASGWTMVVVPYDIADQDYAGEFDTGTVLGSTSYKFHVIKIQNTKGAAAYSPIHEMGHWLDAYTGYPTLTDPEYAVIYEEESEQYRGTFGPTCSWGYPEFFAEGFWCYWHSPNALRRACPAFCTYLESKLNEAEALSKGA